MIIFIDTFGVSIEFAIFWIIKNETNEGFLDILYYNRRIHPGTICWKLNGFCDVFRNSYLKKYSNIEYVTKI